MAKEKGLEPKQKAFCREYVIDFNATQAAIRAGYSKKTAMQQGSALLIKLEVQNEISALVEEQLKASKTALEIRIFKYWMRRAFYDITEIVDLNGQLKLSEEELRKQGLEVCIDSINKKINAQGKVTIVYEFADKDKAIEMLQRYIQMIKDQPVTVKTDTSIVDFMSLLLSVKDPKERERLVSELEKVTDNEKSG